MLAQLLTMALCPSVSLSQVDGVLSKRLNEAGWFLAQELHTIFYTVVRSKIRVLPSGTLLPTQNFTKNLSTAY